MKPGMEAYDEFKTMFEKFSLEAGKKQYLIPYFIAAHPGTTDQDMLNLALWLKKYDFKLDQVQTFTPTPMTVSTCMYYTGLDPKTKKKIYIPYTFVEKKEQKRVLGLKSDIGHED